MATDPQDATRRAMDHQARASREIPVGVQRVSWPNADGNVRIPTLNWNPGDEQPTDPVPTMSDADLRASFGVADAKAEPAPLSFFNGVPYADGVKAYNDYLISKGAK